ncbi:hypothetical protein D9V30_08430 [Mycetocola reblochoni]|nr:hypothetical protein [Mycetocola reblochoni]RLP69323.1 hypothetical protein D9V30_08430 [Mycetocola reblochoni]
MRADAEKHRAARAAMTDSARAAEDWATAVGIASDSTNTATERINAMRQALDLLNGGAMSAAEAQRAVDQSARSISEALSETDKNGKNLASTLIDSAGAIDTTTESGDQLYQSFANLRDNADNALVSMVNAADESGEAWTKADAESAVQGYVDSIRSAGEAAGLSKEQIQGLVDQWVGQPEEKAFILSFTGDEEVRKKLATLAQELGLLPSQVAFAVSSDGTVDAARLEVLRLGADVLNLPEGKSLKIDAPSAGARAELEALGFKVQELPDGRIEVTQTGAQTAGNQIAEVANRSYTATIRVTRVEEIQRAYTDPVAGKPLILQGPGSRNGNLFDGGKAQAFANGGFPTGIYAGRPGAIHKFAEPETGWEAYVSGRPGQEPRNRKILEEAAARLGGVAMFANGGLTGARQGGVTAFAKGGLTDDQKRLLSGVSGIRSSWNQAQRRGENRAAGREGNGLSLVDEVFRLAETSGKRSAASLRRTGLSSEKQFLKLEKQSDKAEKAVTRTTTALSKAKDKLADLRSAAASMASSVASAVRRFYDLGTIGAVKTEKVQETRQVGTGRNAYYETREVEKTTKPTASTIKSGMQKSAAAIKKFADTLKKLQKKGYQPGFLAEVAELGVEEGQPVADALLKASTADRNAINSAYKTINSQSNAAGKTVADANYASLIKKAEAQQKTAQRAADQAKKDAKAVQARMGKETDRLIKAMSKALNSGKGLAFADGGMITAFANGGPRVSQIATGGQNILWAEPETGWEAYISGKPSMRARNIDLMEKVNRRMGSPLTSSPAPNITNKGDTMQVNYHAAPSSAPISDEQQLTRLTRRAYAARARMRTRR